jgi:hypothetical protein
MLSYLFFVVSLVNHSGFVDKDYGAELKDGGATGGLIVRMGPVMNMHVTDVRVTPGQSGLDEMPSIAPKGSLFGRFSKSRLVAVRYGR